MEKQIKDHQRTKEILKKLPDARVIEIDLTKMFSAAESKVSWHRIRQRHSYLQKIKMAAYMRVLRSVRILEMIIFTIVHA